MNEKIIVDGNKEAIITQIKQWRTYRGLLEGLPTTEMNRCRLMATMEDAKKFCGQDEIYLIEPQQTPITIGDNDIYPFGTPASLPNITCIAEIMYSRALRDQTKDFSSLGVIWFQDDYAFPINKDVVAKIKDIPFSKICGEFEW